MRELVIRYQREDKTPVNVHVSFVAVARRAIALAEVPETADEGTPARFLTDLELDSPETLREALNRLTLTSMADSDVSAVCFEQDVTLLLRCLNRQGWPTGPVDFSANAHA